MTLAALHAAYDVIIIGAGPAGLAAAATTASAGMTTLIVDENASSGGQIYRAITTTPVRDRAILGEDYWHGIKLVDDAHASGATLLTGAIVWSLDRDLAVGLSKDGKSRFITGRRVIIATGALERPFPIQGWTLPGVMTAGAAQTMLKASALVPSGRTVLAGTGPLLWLLAAQLVRAGSPPQVLLDTTLRNSWLKAAPHAPGFMLSPLFAKGLALRRELSGTVRIVRGVVALRAEGEGRLQSVTYGTGGETCTIPADTLLLHQGIVPNTNLAMAAGVAHHWDERQLCWVPTLGADGATSIEGIGIAGDGAGIAGGWAAEEQGRLVGLAATCALAPSIALGDAQPIRQRLARHELGRTFLDTFFQPPRSMRIPADDATIVCRCEEVTAGDVRRAAQLGCEGPNQLKAFTRCGMGPCQGRLCGLTVTELIAETRDVPPSRVGHFRLRAPVKPISLSELASMPADEASVKSVVR